MPTDRPTLLSDQDLYLFNEGSNYRMYETMGAHLVTCDGQAGVMFSVWAPNARLVSMVGSFNDWSSRANLLERRGDSGIWEGFVPGATKGALYKFHIESQNYGYHIDKADRLGRVGSRLRMARPGLDAAARRTQLAPRPAIHL